MVSSPPNRQSEPNAEIFPELLLISVDDLATILKVSTRTVWRLLSAGKLVRPVRFGGAVRWRYREVLKWIEDGCLPVDGNGKDY